MGANKLPPTEDLPRNPIQPQIIDSHGVRRFKSNRIVSDLLDYASSRGMDMNTIARGDYTNDDQQQFAQLIGYSLSGYSELSSYVDDDAYKVAYEMGVGRKSEADARIETLERTLTEFRDAIREPVAHLFGVHPDDLH